MKYPESDMNVAVVNESVVDIYGFENDGFRPYKETREFDSHPRAISYANDYNETQREALGLKVRK